mmetsp:Transcript_26308/g.72286  ORF Transcript_26308/g.72286 Transcript_26308/m.72286 type:complete len:106 (+) Transcript_26308:1459-1776(+)
MGEDSHHNRIRDLAMGWMAWTTTTTLSDSDQDWDSEKYSPFRKGEFLCWTGALQDELTPFGTLSQKMQTHTCTCTRQKSTIQNGNASPRVARCLFASYRVRICVE